ncbi:molybdopterin molybdotransferase [Cognatiyoonia koreensis]|uniref:Molybdopterin molybdenumtransferase n=1 Tax=Cognatiyoonia koreensis TaxID=364200 RepID=A0A1I0RE48_9RHOB|nr:gephyrin-like molybdotransferase Glp [Cognatiyoonia koreensis]SEW39119.1 molybdopterin molybdotransferase [Cognatiyoonia koreensis]
MMFDAVLTVDWSGGNDRGKSPKRDAIWTCIGRNGVAEKPIYHRNRQDAEIYILDTLKNERHAGRRILAAFDLCFAFPHGFAEKLTGNPDPLALWDWFEERVEDSPTKNNRFDLAARINAQFPGVGPFWGNGLQRDIPDLPRKGTNRADHGFPEKRKTDVVAKGAFSPWQLAGAGAVGSQVIMGFPTLSRIRNRLSRDVTVWPFETPDSDIVLAETYFSLLPQALAGHTHPIKDAAQVSLYAATFSGLSNAAWAELLEHDADDEGWVLGLGKEHLLTSTLAPPPLRNDCFALPQGAHWTPVDEALDHLRENLQPVTGTETVAVYDAAQRVLAADAIAQRSHPPAPNSAVDGYALLGPLPPGSHAIPLVAGRAAAGFPFEGTVPDGHAVRILTGANMPAGTDTVILQEDVTATDTHIALHGPIKSGANSRRAGEDMQAGRAILKAGRKLTAADLGTMTAVGISEVSVRSRLRVGVLSTGDELRNPQEGADAGQIFDANRPMLLANLKAWGFDAIDLGRAPDNRAKLRKILTKGAARCDAMLTSGGASAGDEDHMSALLQDTGTLALWRVAMKPGRPLALGIWDGVPVFGLPGNPVAAQVCALVFAYPALHLIAGAGWRTPTGYQLPAAFSKSKKAGRREYLRARIHDGQVETFASEGSGRISGLSWATGLVELPDAAITVAPGELVHYIPFAGFNV